MDRTEHRFSPSGRLPGGDFRVRRQFCQQDGAEQQRERAAPPRHVCASAHGGVSGAQSRFAGADCPAGQPCRPADCRARCPADRRMESVHVSPPPSFAAVYAPRRFFMRAGGLPCGGVPFASPGLNPGGTYSLNKKGTRRGACLVCRLPTLPFRKPQGGLAVLVACPAFSFIFCPHPPAPLPLRGRGRLKVNFAGGFAPGTPALNRLRHSQLPPHRHLTGWRDFSPRIPAAPAGANAPFETERTGFPQAKPVSRPAQPWGCKGRSPLHKKTKNPPLPAGKGVGGMGARK